MWWVRCPGYAPGYRDDRPDRTVRRRDGTDIPREFLGPTGGGAAVLGHDVRTDPLAGGRRPTAPLVVGTVGFNTAEPGQS